MVNRLCNKILEHTDEISRIKSHYTEDAEVVVLTYGAPARPGLKAVRMAREQELKVGFIKLDTVWPFPDKAIIKSLKDVQRVIVAEMNLGQIFYEVQRVLPGVKVEKAPKIGGEMHLPQEILELIKSEGSSGG